MYRAPWFAAWVAVCLIGGSGWTLRAQEAPEERPLDVGQEERVRVNLVIVDAVVMDNEGKTVAGLTKDDFRLTVQGQAQEIDTFDVICPEGGLPDPKVVPPKEQREPFTVQSERRLVLAFDYYSLTRPNRAAATQWGRIIAARDMAAGDGIMIVALADGLRIEQRFTGSPKKVYHTLERMEHDVTLYGRDFQPLTPRQVLDNLSQLADVLAQYPGPKAVVLFSEWNAPADDWDNWFLDTAAHAAAARTAFYPVWAEGLQQGSEVTGGSPALARLANESGGRFTRMVNDLSLGYVRARRDLVCRYAIGYYADPEVSRKNRRVQVRAKGYETRTPERVRLWPEEERRAGQLRAAFADPGPNDDPLIRAYAYPFRPMSTKAWETLLAVSFPMYLDEKGARWNLAASLNADHLNIGTSSELIEFPPAKGKPGPRMVTLYATRKIKPGPHDLTVVLSDPEKENVATTKVEFQVPAVPEGLVVRGPVMVRVDPEGIRMRVDDKEVDSSEIDELIGDAGFVPLLVSQITPDDTLLAAWEICVVGSSGPKEATVERRIRAGGEIVHRLDPIPLALEGKKKLSCQSGIDKLAAATLGEGRYRFEVAVTKEKTDEALGLRPFSITVPPPDDDEFAAVEAD